MSLAVAALAADGETMVEDTACMDDSFPGFEQALAVLLGETMSVSGTVLATRTVGLIGYPVEHSLSPAHAQRGFHGSWASITVTCCCLPRRASWSERVREYVNEQGFAGWNVTVPHKEGMLSLSGRDERRGTGHGRVQHCARGGRQADAASTPIRQVSCADWKKRAASMQSRERWCWARAGRRAGWRGR